MDYLERYAELVVQVGLDLREGQHLFVDCAVEHAPFARALAPARYPAWALSLIHI